MKPLSHAKDSNLDIQGDKTMEVWRLLLHLIYRFGLICFLSNNFHAMYALFYPIWTQLYDSFSGEEISAEIHRTCSISSQLWCFSLAAGSSSSSPVPPLKCQRFRWGWETVTPSQTSCFHHDKFNFKTSSWHGQPHGRMISWMVKKKKPWNNNFISQIWLTFQIK